MIDEASPALGGTLSILRGIRDPVLESSDEFFAWQLGKIGPWILQIEWTTCV